MSMQQELATARRPLRKRKILQDDPPTKAIEEVQARISTIKSSLALGL